MNFSIQQRFILSIVAWSLALLGLLGLVIVPILSDIRKTNQEIMAQRKQLETRYEQGLSMSSLREQLEKAQTGLETIDQATLTASDQLNFITTLEQIAEKNQVEYKLQLQGLEETLAQSATDITAIPISLNLTGPYQSLFGTLIAYERTPFLLTVTNLSLAPSQDEKSLNLIAKVQLLSYWRK